MQGAAGEVRMNSWATFSYGFLHVDIPMLANQKRLKSSLCKHWMQLRGATKMVDRDGKCESGNTVLSVQLDDNDDTLLKANMNNICYILGITSKAPMENNVIIYASISTSFWAKSTLSWERCDARWIFKQSKASLNSEVFLHLDWLPYQG